MLKLLPNLVFPITPRTINPLLDNLFQLNLIDAGLNEPQQRALGIYLHAYDLFVKSKGAIDYRNRDGHERLKQDAKTFCPADSLLTRHGDLAAAHLAIDWHDTMCRTKEMGLPPLPDTLNGLMPGCIDLCGLSIAEEKRLGLFMDMLGKKRIL